MFFLFDFRPKKEFITERRGDKWFTRERPSRSNFERWREERERMREERNKKRNPPPVIALGFCAFALFLIVAYALN